MRGDTLRLELNGDPPDGVNRSSSPGFFLDGDADGRPGGDFRLEFQVAPSDEVLAVRYALFRSTTNPGSGFSQYHPFTDVDGSGGSTSVTFWRYAAGSIARPVSRQFQLLLNGQRR